MADLNRIKEEIIRLFDIEDFYRTRLAYHGITNLDYKDDKDGWVTKIHCPMHDDSNTPNFSFNRKTGGYHCFACTPGKNGGSLFDFWCWSHGLDMRQGFKTAVEHLCAEVGIDPPEWSANTEPSVAPIDATKTPAPRRGIVKTNKAELADKSKPPMEKKQAEIFHKALTPEHYKYLTTRGLTDNTIKKFLIGVDLTSTSARYQDINGDWKHGRYTIPVYGADGQLRNIRKYGVNCQKKYKMLNSKGFGSPCRLFCLDQLLKYNWQHVIICEGEWDCLLINQELEKLGISESWGAVTGTAGVGTFEPEWLEHFYNRHIYIMFDVDKVSLAAAADHCTQYFLEPHKLHKFSGLKIIKLPLDGSEEMNDVSDYLLKTGQSFTELIRLINRTGEVVAGGVSNDEASVAPIYVDDLVACILDRKYIDQRVQVPLTISGNSSKIYHAVRSYCVIDCPLEEKLMCCNQGCGEKLIPYGNEVFIQSCNASRIKVQNAIIDIACKNKQKPRIEPKTKVVMEEYYATQVVSRWKVEENADGKMENVQELTQVTVYVLQPEKSYKVKPQNYMATGWVRTHPETSVSTLFIEHMEAMEDDWTTYDSKLPENIEKLKQIPEIGVAEMLSQITNGVTQIYESDHILITILLTYLSPLWYAFNGQIIRGWINSCIIGDSGTGKSKTYQRIADWIGVGDHFSALTGKRTGLLYAVKTRGNNEWYVSVGRYVMANKKIIAIDEAQEIESEDISKMGICMEDGWLDVAAVAAGSYQTEVRSIFMLNPKADGRQKTISDYSFGCLCLKDLFDPRFIRRIDLAVFCTGKNTYEFYNQRYKGKPPAEELKISADVFKNLVFWAWTRKVDNIHWETEAEDAVLKVAVTLSTKYGDADDIPLICPTDVRLNIARLATAYAVLAGSFTEDHQGVVVKEQHVNFVAAFIDQLYSDVSCNLATHSRLSGKKKTLSNYEQIRDQFNAYIEHTRSSVNVQYARANYFCQLLLLLQQNEFIRKRDLMEQLSMPMDWINRHMSILRMFDLIEYRQGGYKVTRKFNNFMQRWSQDTIKDEDDPSKMVTVEKMLEAVYNKLGENALQNPRQHNLNEQDTHAISSGRNGYSNGAATADYERHRQEEQHPPQSEDLF